MLGRAGATITDVRTNLESTSKTLGVSTAAHLKESTDSLAGTMSGLKDQLGSLKTDLDATVSGTESTTIAQLSQTVGTVDAMLGDTKAAPPRPVLNGSGCSTVVAPSDKSSTVYSSLVLMSAQLDGFAQSTASCRDEVADVAEAHRRPRETDRGNLHRTLDDLRVPRLLGFRCRSTRQPRPAGRRTGRRPGTGNPRRRTGTPRGNLRGIDELAAKLDELDKTASADDVNRAIGTLRTSISEAKTPLKSLRTEIDKIDVALEDLEARLR